MGEVLLRKTQAVIEATRGTRIPATRKVYGKGMMVDKTNMIRPTNEERASFEQYFRAQAGDIVDTFSFDGAVTYEDIAWWFQLALKGGVVGVLSNVAAYTYTFVPTQAVDDLKSATLEWGDDTQAFTSGFAMVESLEITYAKGASLQLKASLVTDHWEIATFTGSIVDRVTEDALAQLSKFAVGPAGAVPNSYITGRMIGAKLTIKNNLNPKFFLDGVQGYYTGMGRKARSFTLEITQEGNANTITERSNFRLATPRVVRVTSTGSTIPTSSPATSKSLDIVMPGIWTSFDPGDNNTNTMFTGIFEAMYDATLGYALSAAVVNGLSTLP